MMGPEVRAPICASGQRLVLASHLPQRRDNLGFLISFPSGKGDWNSLKVVSKHQILYYKYIFKCLSLFILWGKNVVSVLSKHH